MKKIVLFILVQFHLSSIFSAGIEQFELSLNKDITLGIASVALFTSGNLLRFNSDSDANQFNWPDEGFTFEYNADIDLISDYLFFSPLLALPFLVDNYDADSLSTLITMGLETALTIYGIKYIAKSLIQRPRPYNYYSSTPDSLLEDKDRNYSFPSGHTATAFGCASFCTYIYSQSDATTLQKVLMGGITFSIAALTGALRIYSGNHYLTDVIAGAILGTTVGILIPYLHNKENIFSDSDSSGSKSISLTIGFNTIGFFIML